MYTLQWSGGAVSDPDILRQMFHSAQTPPNGYNRGFFSNPTLDTLLDQASIEINPARRLELYGQVQQLVADQVACISIWTKTNFVVAQRSIRGVHLSPFADFFFLKDVSRAPAAAAN